jgi:hypothetical protein
MDAAASLHKTRLLLATACSAPPADVSRASKQFLSCWETRPIALLTGAFSKGVHRKMALILKPGGEAPWRCSLRPSPTRRTRIPQVGLNGNYQKPKIVARLTRLSLTARKAKGLYSSRIFRLPPPFQVTIVLGQSQAGVPVTGDLA